MSDPQPTRQFGPFTLDTNKRLLWRDGEPIALAPKVLETLLVLVASRDRVVSKDELLERVWNGAAVEEGGLARNISVLRKALGEKPDQHRFIVTVPGRGYRFVADVREETPARPDVEAVEPALPERVTVKRTPSRRFVLAGAALAAAGLALLIWRPTQAVEPRRSPMTSLAVLPLQDLSGDPSQAYFADGMTEALIGSLARIRALRVVSRTSAMRFKGTSRSVPEIADALGVDAVVEGSVQRTNGRVRITVQLIHGETDTHVWAREYERNLTDVLELQSELARAIAEEIQVQITADERARLVAAERVRPDAYLEYLLGQHYLWRPGEEELSRAIEHFERAVRLDPDYAPAHAGLSHAWWWRGIWGAQTLKQVEAASRAAASRALALDPQLAEAHVSLGRIKFVYDWDWTGAEKDLGRALELDPNSLDAHFFHGMLFMALGRFPEAIDHMGKAEALDPLSATVQSAYGRILYRARRFDEAIVHLKQAISLEPQSPGPYHRLADVFEEVRRYSEAMAMSAAAEKLAPQGPGRRAADVARIYARMGRRDEARRILSGLTTSKPAWFAVATVFAALGDKDEAFRLLFAAVEDRGSLNYVKTDPRFDVLHSDRRWPELLRRMNLSVDPERGGSSSARDENGYLARGVSSGSRPSP
jgi:TolB-like protein/DNA-binding winged helix-turn-helix (wHTH) protein/Tfp pilus assembly protein PilF